MAKDYYFITSNYKFDFCSLPATEDYFFGSVKQVTYPVRSHQNFEFFLIFLTEFWNFLREISGKISFS